MARRRTTSLGRTRQVVIIGHNSQVLPTVALFVGGGLSVQVYTCDDDVEERLALYPGVTVVRVQGEYQSAPADLPDCPYFICVDGPDLARRIRSWLPRTLAIFHVGTERKGKTAAAGFLGLGEPQSSARKRVLRRLALLARIDRLLDMARHAERPVILMYGDPDPDAIGAALALATIWRSIGVNAAIRYTGEVQRYQNKLLLSYLKEPIERLREGELEASELVALVDAQPSFWKSDPPRVHAVIDHHPIREETQAVYQDLRELCGSTSSILTEYLVAADMPLRRRVATALMYGLITDTADLTRNVHAVDIRAFDVLHARADGHFLSRLAKSQIPLNLLDHIAWGISHRLIYRDMMLIHFGEIATPDVLIQTADTMLTTCGINWVVCAGKHKDRLIVAFRGDGHRQDVGARARSAFVKLGSAGGHRTMGRAEITLHGEHVDATVDILIDNLFRRMSAHRRTELIRTIRNHLHGPGPTTASALA